MLYYQQQKKLSRKNHNDHGGGATIAKKWENSFQNRIEFFLPKMYDVQW